MTATNGRHRPSSPPTLPPMKRSDWLLLVALSIPWGGSFLFFRILAPALPPLTLAFARVAIAALALATTQLPGVWRARQHWRAFLALGLFNNALPFALFAYGEHTIPAGIAAICNALTPIFTLLALRAARRTPPLTITHWLGIALGFAGVTLLAGPASLSAASLLGTAACIAAALSYGLAALFMPPLRSLPPLTTATAQLLASTVLLAAPALLDHPWTLPPLSLHAWAALLALALVSTAFAYLLFFKIVASAGPANAMLVTYLVPISAVALSATFLGEAITPPAIAGALLIALGLLLLDGRLTRRVPATP